MAKIQYEDKEQLNVNETIPAKNKCMANDMNEIKNIVNGNDDLVGDLSTLATTEKSSVVGAINELEGNIILNKYDYTETIIGKWGSRNRNVYRKIVDFGTLPNATTKTVASGLVHSDVTFINAYCVARATNSTAIPLSSFRYIQNTGIEFYLTASNTIEINTQIDRSDFTEAYVVLEYLKNNE